jgi:hypothetical protein
MWDKIKLKQTEDNHCEMQIMDRNATHEQIVATVSAYDNWELQENGRYNLSKRFGEAVLHVIVSATTSAANTIGRVVTVYPKDRGKMP